MLLDAIVPFLEAQGAGLARTAGIGALCVALELWRPAVPQRRLRPGIPTDLAHEMVGRVLDRIVTTPIAAAVAFLLPTPPDTGLAALPFGVALVLGTVISDFLGYWRHRWQHGALLWRFHAVHHSSRWLDWLSTSRFHPMDEGVTQLLQVVPLWALGFSPGVIAAAAVIRAVYGTFVHANFDLRLGPLERVIVTPRFHRWHHSDEAAAHGKNMATILSLWDLLFGTYYLPDRWPASTGIEGDPIPDDYAAQIVRPFTRPVAT